MVFLSFDCCGALFPLHQRGARGDWVWGGEFSEWPGSARGWSPGLPAASNFLCLCKESHQRKHTPVRRPLRGFPALLGRPGWLINSHDPRYARPRARTYSPDTPRPACATRRRTGGGARCSITRSGVAGLLSPLCAVPQIGCGRAGIGASTVRAPQRGMGCMPRQGELRSPARMRPSQGPRSGGAPGAPSLGYLSWQDKKGNQHAGLPPALRVEHCRPIQESNQTVPFRIPLCREREQRPAAGNRK
jgi:hypothetical protein